MAKLDDRSLITVWRVWRGSGNDDAHQGVDRVGSTAKDSFDAGFVEDVKAAVAVFTVFLYASGLAGVSLSLSLSLSLSTLITHRFDLT